MIVTVTPNTAIDYTLRVPEFTLGRTIRATESAWGMGGKAADAGWILAHWGVPNLALGFAAGQNGQRMRKMLQDRGCKTNFVWVEGETRLNTVICMGGCHSTFSSSTLDVSPQRLAAFFAGYRQVIKDASCVIVGGSLPRGVPETFFKDVIHLARERSIPVIFDSSGAALRAGLEAAPTVIKPNLPELLGLAADNNPRDSVETSPADRRKLVYQLGQQVQAKYGVSVVVTLGSEGALAFFSDTQYWIPPLKVNVVSAAGAGDAVLAGLAWAYSQQAPITEGLRLGFALASAVLLATATADYNLDDARKFLPLVNVLPITTEKDLEREPEFNEIAGEQLR